jgi:hypothetical protein
MPIQTVRSHGCIESPEAPNGALWLIGFKNKEAETELEVMPQIMLCNSESK